MSLQSKQLIAILKTISFIKHLPVLTARAGVIAFCLLQTITCAQKHQNIPVSVNAFYGTTRLVLDSNYIGREGGALKIETLRFYISNLRFTQDDSVTWKEKDSYHLYDRSSEKNTFNVSVPASIRFNKIQFDLGIDSLTNVSGVMGGDLDPTKGMYWTWQSGYINLKLEGKSEQCSNPKKEFQFHLGGYQYPYKTMQTVSLNLSSKDQVHVVFDVEQFLRTVDLHKQDHIMSPDDEAVRLSLAAAACFRIQ